MAILLAAISRRRKDFPSVGSIERALPPGCIKSIVATRENVFLCSVRYGSVSDHQLMQIGEWDFEFSGLVSDDTKRNLFADLTGDFNKGGMPITRYPTQFCALGVRSNQILGFVSGPGTDQLFTYEDEDFIVISNRHNLIALFLNENKAKVRRDALLLTLVQDHIRDYGTSIENIRRTEPGTVIRASLDGIFYGTSHPLDWTTKIGADSLIERLGELSDNYCSLLSNYDRVELGISGGKDSRAILGLLLSGDFPRESLRLFTGGEAYAPDVMSAQDVVAIAGLTQQHVVSAPSFALKDTFGDALSWDLWTDSAGTSLADFRQPPRSNLGCTGIRVGGHEIGFKQHPNNLELEDYLQSRVRPWLMHPLVKPAACNDIAEKFIKNMRGRLKDVPVHRYNVIDLAYNHIALHTSSTLTASHLGNFEVHPFLDPRFLELLVCADDELVVSQFIHYVLMRRAPMALESPAFANDEWPGGLFGIAEKVSIPFRGIPEPPYKFMDFFPSQSAFGRHAWRFRLYGMYIPWIKEYIHDNSDRLDFLNVNNIDNLLIGDSRDWNFRDIYRIGALLKLCLTDYFGIRAWNISNRKSIEEEINRFAAPQHGLQGNNRSFLSKGEMLARTESALAQSIRLMRRP